MSERSDLSSSADTVQSIGAYLALQRRLRGISPQQLAEITRIPLRSIERLEAGLYDSDLDGFARGFVRTVAKALGLDSHETLARTLREPSGGESRASDVRLFWGRTLALVALLAGLVGVGVLALEAVRALSSSPSARPDYVYRRDPVRALAQAQQRYVALEPAKEQAPGLLFTAFQQTWPISCS